MNYTDSAGLLVFPSIKLLCALLKPIMKFKSIIFLWWQEGSKHFTQHKNIFRKLNIFKKHECFVGCWLTLYVKVKQNNYKTWIDSYSHIHYYSFVYELLQYCKRWGYNRGKTNVKIFAVKSLWFFKRLHQIVTSTSFFPFNVDNK